MAILLATGLIGLVIPGVPRSARIAATVAGTAATLLVRVHLEGDDVGEEFTRLGGHVYRRGYRVTRSYGIRLRNETRLQARRVMDATDYPNSIRMQMGKDRDRPVAIVGSDAPQAHRLEYGFIGTDALGRVVEQQPRPHFRPAFERIAPLYEDAIGRLLPR